MCGNVVCFGTTVINQNHTDKAIRSRLNSGNGFYYPLQNPIHIIQNSSLNVTPKILKISNPLINMATLLKNSE